jgi:hypothetical protein
MNFKHLKILDPVRVKALFGFHPLILADILIIVLPELERRRAERLAKRQNRKRPPIPNDGKPRDVLPIHKALMVFLYLRHNVSHEVVGGFFGFSADTSENAFHDVVPILRDLFPKEKWEAEKKWRKSEPSWTPDDVERTIIDSFETPIPRPSLNDRQKRVYSGKKKRHTLKTQVITDQNGEILDANAGHRGPAADVKIYNQFPPAPPVDDKPRLGDKAYVGAQPEVQTPQKKPQGGELSAAQKEENKRISSQRVRVEHGIRRIKAFRILRDEYRHAMGLFPMVASAVIGLIQFTRIVG